MAFAPASWRSTAGPRRGVETPLGARSELATAVDEREALCGATWGLWTHYFLRGEMEPALANGANRCEYGRQDAKHIPGARSCACAPYSHYSRGEYRDALSAGREGIARYEEESDLRALRTFQLSPSLALPTLLANVHWFLGDDAEADAAIARAHAMAEDLKHPPALVHCLCVSSYFLLFSEQWDRLAPIAERALSVSLEEGFRFWMPMARISLAFVEAEKGNRDGAIRRIIENISKSKKTGSSLVMSQFEPRLGELLIQSRRPRAGCRTSFNKYRRCGAARRAHLFARTLSRPRACSQHAWRSRACSARHAGCGGYRYRAGCRTLDPPRRGEPARSLGGRLVASRIWQSIGRGR